MNVAQWYSLLVYDVRSVTILILVIWDTDFFWKFVVNYDFCQRLVLKWMDETQMADTGSLDDTYNVNFRMTVSTFVSFVVDSYSRFRNTPVPER